MYDELIKRLRYCRNNAAVITDDELMAIADQAADAIEDLDYIAETYAETVHELEEKNRWIPVTERLPEEDGRYLTVYWLGTIPNIPWITPAFFAKNLRNVDKYDFPKKKSGFYDSHSDYGYFEITGITHWMPLPQPPKEE